MSLHTFSVLVVKRENLSKLLFSGLTYEVKTWYGNLQEISENLILLKQAGSFKFFNYRHESLQDEFNTIYVKLVSKNHKYDYEEEFSSVGVEISSDLQNILSVDMSEIIISVDFPSFSGFNFTAILEQKELIIEFIEHLQPEFGFATNEHEIERIYNTSYMDLIRFGRDWAIMSKEAERLAREEIDLDEKFKNILDLGKLVWLDNL